MIFYQIHVFLRCFIRSSKTSLFTMIPGTSGKPYNLGSLGSPGRCWAPWAAWAPWALLGYPGQFLGDPSYRIRVFLCVLGDPSYRIHVLSLYFYIVFYQFRPEFEQKYRILSCIRCLESNNCRVCKQQRRVRCGLWCVYVVKHVYFEAS